MLHSHHAGVFPSAVNRPSTEVTSGRKAGLVLKYKMKKEVELLGSIPATDSARAYVSYSTQYFIQFPSL